VRSFPRRFVDDNNSVEGRRFGWTRHTLLEFAQRQQISCCDIAEMAVELSNLRRAEKAGAESTRPPEFLLFVAGFRSGCRTLRNRRA
jgi:hypothetical protein